MKRQIFFSFTLILLLFCFLYGQKRQQQFQQEKHGVTVSLVLVDVVATDKEGNFETHLTKNDFEVYEDGERVPINSLELINLLIRESEAAEKGAAKTPDSFSREKRFIVIFDSISTVKRELERSKPEIIERLISLVRLGQEIMVFELDEKEGMRLLQPFTTDEKLIARAVKEASGSIWVEKSADILAVPRIFEEDKYFDMAKHKESLGEIYRFYARKKFEKIINGLLNVMNIIKDLPGRKSVLLISGGIPSLHSEIDAAKISDPFKILSKSVFRRGDDILNNLTQFANSHNITFYAMDPDDYLRFFFDDTAYDGFKREGYEEIKKSELYNLYSLSEKTGGVSLKGAKKFDDFEKVVNRDLTFYYELSYYPKREKADGRYHKIDVKINQPGIQIRFRKGYYDYTEEQRESLLFASASSNPSLFKQIPFEAQVIPFVQTKEGITLWVNIALSAKSLLLENRENQASKSLKLNIWASDLENKKAFSSQVDIPLILTPSFLKSLKKAEHLGFNCCSQELEFKKDKYRIILALYDESLGQLGTVEQMLVVPDLKDGGEPEIINAVMGNLVEDAKGGIRTFKISEKDGTLQLSKHKFYPFGLNQFRRRKDISLFLQVFSPQKKALFNPRFSLIQDGKVIGSLPAEVVEKSWNRKAGIWDAVFSLNFENFSEGEYILSIKLIDPSENLEIKKELRIEII